MTALVMSAFVRVLLVVMAALRLSRFDALPVVRPCEVSAVCTFAAVRTAVPVVASTGTPRATLPAAGIAAVPVNAPAA
jgi:hypothetical protein